MGPSGLLLFLSMGSALFPISLPMGSIKLPIGQGPLPSLTSNICGPHPVSGTCLSEITRWFYSPEQRKCENYFYCGGNPNNFMTLEDCKRACSLSAQLRPSSCPPPSAFPKKSCRDFCSAHGDCSGDRLCCDTGCGHQCHLAVGAIRGYCPWRNPLDSHPLLCGSSCQQDADCTLAYPGRKCCRYGCVETCVPPVEEHPGACPKMPVIQTVEPCRNACADDRQCPPKKKCCFDGCRLSCLDPVRYSQCHLPAKPGPCPAVHHRYFYNRSQGRCQLFLYGCMGNTNNFRSMSECQRACGRSQPCRPAFSPENPEGAAAAIGIGTKKLLIKSPQPEQGDGRGRGPPATPIKASD
ncbi:actinia tenebrosa protease inhibitors-like [Pantherophis guttatus]|uniref:Actinia tenebrosa protease inhibitors-like n=1 Tax=Pantherophis guttatus TaxID=94885 RepID=A0ABM3ZK08_PANGU|nr:actinia tenebrosa protease inhibitors-like [Pantherophis guttatus]